MLARYAAQPGAVAVIGIDVQDQPADALTLLASLGVHYPSVTDPHAALLAALHSPPVLPLSYVLHPDGTITPVSPPMVFTSPEQIAQVVASSLSQNPH